MVGPASWRRSAPAEIAGTLAQDPGHELMGLFARSLRDLGAPRRRRAGGCFVACASAGDSAVALRRRLAAWELLRRRSRYDELAVPFLKRAQIAAADLARAGVTALAATSAG